MNGVAPALIGETKMLPGTDPELAQSTCDANAHDFVILLANIRNKGIPLGRYGSPDEIAETVIWMVKTRYVTNKVVGVDGGWFPQ